MERMIRREFATDVIELLQIGIALVFRVFDANWVWKLIPV